MSLSGSLSPPLSPHEYIHPLGKRRAAAAPPKKKDYARQWSMRLGVTCSLFSPRMRVRMSRVVQS